MRRDVHQESAGGPRLGGFESGVLAAATSTEFSMVAGALAAMAGALLSAARSPGSAAIGLRALTWPTPPSRKREASERHRTLTYNRWHRSAPRTSVVPPASSRSVPSGPLLVTVASAPGMKPASSR
jgi:hypothetical protein